jgi:hypothetical protein
MFDRKGIKMGAAMVRGFKIGPNGAILVLLAIAVFY